MEDTSINTSVSINLNQNDMVELIIEEQKEGIETELKSLNIALGLHLGYCEQYKKELEEILLSSNGAKNTKTYKTFTKGAKAMGMTPDTKVSVFYNTLETHEFWKWPLSNYIQYYKNPMSQLRKNMAMEEQHYSHGINYRGEPKQAKFKITAPESVAVTFQAANEEKTIGLNAKTETVTALKLNKAAKDKIRLLNESEVKIFEINRDIHALEIQLFGLEYDGVRNKAKFVKGILRNTETGKNLVTLLEGFKNQSLLEAKN